MNEKEIAEIRRRFNPQKTNITSIHGSFVNDRREIIAEFTLPLATLTQDETEAVLSVLKKLLSGTPSKNLIDIEFTNEQVLHGEEHKRLLRLRDSSLDDEAALKSLCTDITETVRIIMMFSHTARTEKRTRIPPSCSIILYAESSPLKPQSRS